MPKRKSVGCDSYKVLCYRAGRINEALDQGGNPGLSHKNLSVSEADIITENFIRILI